jgi:hypothetical protein
MWGGYGLAGLVGRYVSLQSVEVQMVQLVQKSGMLLFLFRVPEITVKKVGFLNSMITAMITRISQGRP